MEHSSKLPNLTAGQFWIKQFIMGQAETNIGTTEREAEKLENVEDYVEQIFYKTVYLEKETA